MLIAVSCAPTWTAARRTNPAAADGALHGRLGSANNAPTVANRRSELNSRSTSAPKLSLPLTIPNWSFGPEQDRKDHLAHSIGPNGCLSPEVTYYREPDKNY
jgi:hypothetical protein